MKLLRFLIAWLWLAPALQAKDFFLKKFSAKEGEQSPQQIQDVLEDQRGIIYVADATGVLEYDGIVWRVIAMPKGGPAQALGSDQNGRVYVAGAGEIGYLTPDSNGRMEFWSLTNQLNPEQRQALQGFVQIHSMGLAMAFVTERRVYVWLDNKITEYEAPSEIHSALGLPNELLLVDSKAGLMRLKDGKLAPVENGGFFSASALHRGQDGRIFAGSLSDGLVTLELGERASFRSLPQQDKTSLMGAVITRVRVFDDSIFVATIGKGLNIYSAKTGQSIPLPDKLRKDIGPDVVALTTDGQGRIWVGTLQGMYVITDREGAPARLEKNAEEKPDFYAYVRSCVSMKDQEVIFGGAFFKELGGVQTLEASNLNRPELPFTQNALRFSYASSDLVNADSVEYQTRLVGFDEDWTEWSNRNYREFTNLVWKKYVFEVRARRQDKVSPIASFELKILPPWYERYWFYLVQLGVLAALMLLITYLRGWTNRTNTTEKLNGVVVGTIWGYTFSKVGVQGVIWAMSGGAAFLAIITNAFMGIFLKPMQKKLEGRIIRLEDNLIRRYKKTGNQEQIDQKIQQLKGRPRFKPSPKAYPPRHHIRPPETAAQRKVTRLTRPQPKPASNLKKSA